MPRILVIDDDPGVRDSMERMLRLAGYTVQSAASGEEGFDIARGGLFDVILSDMRMPGISGIDVLRKLRDVRVDAAFIVMTGFGTVDTAVEAMKLGAVDFVQKPFFRDELLMRVRSAADRRQLARQVELLQRQMQPAATNVDLTGAVETGDFRRDLFYRLNVHRVHLPALREREGDVRRLSEHFLARYGNGRVSACSPAGWDALLAYDYPGNVRQLQHIIQRAVAVAQGAVLETGDLSEEVLASRSAPAAGEGTVAAARERGERDMLVATLARHHGEISSAARELQVSRTT